jgi:type IV pilus assembly protein PilE
MKDKKPLEKQEDNMKVKGFSLIELLVVVSILFGLLALGRQRYVQHIEKTKLTQAQSDLLILASKLEQYKLFNGNYLGAAGSRSSGDGTGESPVTNTGSPWIFQAYSPANKLEQDAIFTLAISFVSNNGLEYQITATAINDKDKKRYGVLIYYSDGRRGYDRNKDGEFANNEQCWDC